MPSFNSTIIVGYLTRDPELRYIPSGAAVCDFTVAVNETWKTQDGEKRESVSFIDCVTWNGSAENLSKYQRKGSLVLVQGKLRQETWEDKNTGEKRSKLRVVAEKIQFMPSGKKQDGDKQEDKRGMTNDEVRQVKSGPKPEVEGGENDDVPF